MSNHDEQIQTSLRKFFIDRAWLHPDEVLKPGDSLLEKGVIDSMAMIELTTFIGESFGIEVADEDLMPENFDSLMAISGYIRKKQGD